MTDAASLAGGTGRTPGRPARAAARRGAGAAVALLALLAITALAAGGCTGGASPGGTAGTGTPSAAAPASAAPSPPPGGTPAASPTLTPSPVVSNPTPVTGTGEVPGAVIDAAKAEAATRAGVEVADVVLVSADAIAWPSGALGCPQVGFLYTDMITPGFRVVVHAGTRDYDYRAAASGGAVRWCENPPPTS